MTKTDPLRKRLIESEASWLVYGQGEMAVEMPSSFGSVELEYAAIRKGCVLLDQPQRATIRMTGDDRRGLMTRLFTQELKDLDAGMCKRALWLSKLGRIDADLRIVEFENETYLDLDRNIVSASVDSIDRYIIADDVVIEDVTGSWRRLALHGPTAQTLVERLTGIGALEEGAAVDAMIAGVRAIIDRQDSLGVPGYELLIDSSGAHTVDEAITDAGEADESLRLRRAGWLACNTARIEAGWPLFLTDFGPDSIPNELGELMPDRVSMTKGCYLGQEVVARIYAQGKPKRLLAAVRFDREVVTGIADDGAEEERTIQPHTAASLLDSPDGKVIGAITSSTLSPMLGDVPIALVTMKTDLATEGTIVHADLGNKSLRGTVQGQLRFL